MFTLSTSLSSADRWLGRPANNALVSASVAFVMALLVCAGDWIASRFDRPEFMAVVGWFSIVFVADAIQSLVKAFRRPPAGPRAHVAGGLCLAYLYVVIVSCVLFPDVGP